MHKNNSQAVGGEDQTQEEVSRKRRVETVDRGTEPIYETIVEVSETSGSQSSYLTALESDQETETLSEIVLPERDQLRILQSQHPEEQDGGRSTGMDIPEISSSASTCEREYLMNEIGVHLPPIAPEAYPNHQAHLRNLSSITADNDSEPSTLKEQISLPEITPRQPSASPSHRRQPSALPMMQYTNSEHHDEGPAPVYAAGQLVPQFSTESVVSNGTVISYPEGSRPNTAPEVMRPIERPATSDINQALASLDQQAMEVIFLEKSIQELSIRLNRIQKEISINRLIIKSALDVERLDKAIQTDRCEVIPPEVAIIEQVNPPRPPPPPSSSPLMVPSIQAPILPSGEPLKLRKSVNEELGEFLRRRMVRLPAMVKGYLTRRLWQTERVQNIIQTIRDSALLVEEYERKSLERSAKLQDPDAVLDDDYKALLEEEEEEYQFQLRLMSQIEASILEFHSLFFKYTKAEQMELIARHRALERDRMIRSLSYNNSRSSPFDQKRPTDSAAGPRVSSATRKSLERKKNARAGHQLEPVTVHHVKKEKKNSKGGTRRKKHVTAEGGSDVSDENSSSHVTNSQSVSLAPLKHHSGVPTHGQHSKSDGSVKQSSMGKKSKKQKV